MQQTKTLQKNELAPSVMLWVAFGTLLLSTSFRVVQLFTNIEPHTGFFKPQNAWLNYVVYAVVLLSALALFLLAQLSKNIPASRPVVRKNLPLAFSGFFFAAGLGMDAAMGILHLMQTFKAFHVGSGEISKLLFSGGMLTEVFEALCAVLACVYFVLVGLSYANQGAAYSEYKLLALTPLFWALFRMVSRFMTKISFLEVSELVLELVLLAFMSLFFLSFARVSSQIGQKGEMRKVFRYGLVSGFLALLLSVSRFICLVSGHGELVASGFAFSIADLGFGLFTLSYLYVHLKYGRPASEEDALSEEAEEEAEAKEAPTEQNTEESAENINHSDDMEESL